MNLSAYHVREQALELESKGNWYTIKGGFPMEDKMRKDFGKQTWSFPLPVLIIATYNEDGTANAMNAAWGGIYDTNKIMLCLSADHKTTKNIGIKKAFTVSFADASHVAACDYVGLVSGNKVTDKLQKAGFTTSAASHVEAPIIDQLPVALECTLEKINEDGIVIGNIVNVCADEAVLGEDGKIDLAKFSPISYEPVHHTYVVMGQAVGKAFSDGNSIK